MTTNQITNDTTHAAPELRFPEFHDDWQVKRLGEIAEIVSEKENNSIDNYVSTENLLPNYGGVIFDAKISSINSITKYKLGDILLSNIRPYLKKIWQANVNGTASNDVIVFRVSNTFDDSFICFVLKNDRFIDYVMASAKGVKMPRGDKNMMLNYAVSFPTLSEQRKIALCLSSLDDLIKSVGDKIELLKQHKKGLMQKLFPKNNCAVPELRFPEFSGDWQVKLLGDCFDERIEKKCINLPLLSLTENGIIPQEETNRKDNSNADKSKYLRVCIGDIAYNTMRMWQGRCVWVDTEGIVSPAYTVCKPKENIFSLFVYYMFKTRKMINVFHQHSQGLVNDTLNLKYEKFSAIRVSVPSLAEQQKIAACLSSIDSEIETNEQKLTKLQEHKKGLMQKMFVKIR